MFEDFLKQLESSGRKKIINDREDLEPYLERWYVTFPDGHQRKQKYVPFNTFVHRFWLSDTSTFHTHPWLWFHSTIIKGSYIEHTPWGSKQYNVGDQRFVDCRSMRYLDDDPEKPLVPENLHWLEIPTPGETWTLFTRGPDKDETFWGFMPNLETGEIVNYEKYLAQYRKSKV